MTTTMEQTTEDNLTLIGQGAEAKIYRGYFYGKPVIIKERFSKKYRHPILDRTLTMTRTKCEVRSIMRCRLNGIPTPAVYLVDLESHKIYMEHLVDTMTTRDYIKSVHKQLKGKDFVEKLHKIAQNIGKNIAKMHEKNIVHGDLTTSNILLRSNKEDVVFIDFGLSYMEHVAEDKGVDLYVLERAFLSTHPNSQALFDIILHSYISHNNKAASEVIKKLDEVRLRGRKRTMVG